MLRLEIKAFIIFLLCFLFACKEKTSKAARQKRIFYKTYSTRQVGSKEYMSVWNTARDSIKLWAEDRLEGYKIYDDQEWFLDSLICFNKEVDRCIMALSYQRDRWSPSDGMDYFNGAKIKGKWYFFFGGGHFVLPRDYYQSDIRIPLNIEQFNEIAINNIFRGYLKKNLKDEWEINDAFFTSHFEHVGWGDFKRYQDTVVYGKRFANKKEYFENIYLRVAKNR